MRNAGDEIEMVTICPKSNQSAGRNGVDTSRFVKPAIPAVGSDAIPLRHELEFVRVSSDGSARANSGAALHCAAVVRSMLRAACSRAQHGKPLGCKPPWTSTGDVCGPAAGTATARSTTPNHGPRRSNRPAQRRPAVPPPQPVQDPRLPHLARPKRVLARPTTRRHRDPSRLTPTAKTPLVTVVQSRTAAGPAVRRGRRRSR